jgi:hypothetical protein
LIIQYRKGSHTGKLINGNNEEEEIMEMRGETEEIRLWYEASANLKIDSMKQFI